MVLESPSTLSFHFNTKQGEPKNMTPTIKEFYQIKQELEQMIPPGFKVEFCYIWNSEKKTVIESDQYISSVSVGKIRTEASTLWLIHIDTVEELEAFKEWKSFEPSPVAIAADNYWEESLKTGSLSADFNSSQPIPDYQYTGTGHTHIGENR